MDKIYHVFISSTYSDLRDERKKVSEAISKAGYVAEGMELFPASSQRQFDFIKRVIDRCDYYVVIVGGRYGSLADENISYTEAEYDYALQNVIPTLAFLHANPEQIPSGKTEKKPSLASKLSAFRERLSGSGMVDFWINPDELATKVAVSLAQESTRNPGIGWVRGNQAIDPRLIQELEEVRNERDALKERSSGIEFYFPDWVGDLDEIRKFILSINVSPKFNENKSNTELEDVVESNWSDIFQEFGERLFFGATNNEFDILFVNYFEKLRSKDPETDFLVNKKINNIYPGPRLARDIFLACDLITVHTYREDGYSYTELKTTEKGSKYLSYLSIRSFNTDLR